MKINSKWRLGLRHDSMAAHKLSSTNKTLEEKIILTNFNKPGLAAVYLTNFQF